MVWAAIAFAFAVLSLIVGQVDPMTLLAGAAELGIVLALFAAVCFAEAFN